MPRLIVLMGAPGSGKSTHAKTLAGSVVTTDGGRERGQSAGETLHSAYKQINQMLAAGKDVVFDTTGANPHVRKAAASIAKKHGAQLSACVMDTPVQACLDAQKSRQKPVAAEDVRRIHDSVQRQMGGLRKEGFQSVDVVKGRK